MPTEWYASHTIGKYSRPPSYCWDVNGTGFADYSTYIKAPICLTSLASIVQIFVKKWRWGLSSVLSIGWATIRDGIWTLFSRQTVYNFFLWKYTAPVDINSLSIQYWSSARLYLMSGGPFKVGQGLWKVGSPNTYGSSQTVTW